MTYLRLLALISLSGSLTLQAAATPPPDVRGASIMVIDANSGDILFERNADERRPVASTQKLLTSLIVAERGNLDKTVVIQPVDEATEPTKLNLVPGTSYTRRDLLTALLVKSPNDVARALARDAAGSVEDFASLMNGKARELGMTSSHFMNPNGLPIDDQYSTARDMSKVARAVHANPVLAPIVTIKYLNFLYSDGRIHQLRNTNQTMRDNWFCTGMKTGYTEKAKHCLVSSGCANGREVIVVYLGGTKERTFTDSAKLLRWALGLPQDAGVAIERTARKYYNKINPFATPTPPPAPKKHRHHHYKPSSATSQNT
ncbi:MAG: D-alanyl-D-alanine carboxypeptidase family protein [bacterium]